jgi:hypothetical protein
VAEAVFLPEGTFLRQPTLATEPFLKLWKQEVSVLLLALGKMTEGRWPLSRTYPSAAKPQPSRGAPIPGRSSPDSTWLP